MLCQYCTHSHTFHFLIYLPIEEVEATKGVRLLKMAALRILLLKATAIIWLLLILHSMPSTSSLQAKRSNARCIPIPE
jgi:hypothetical protein